MADMSSALQLRSEHQHLEVDHRIALLSFDVGGHGKSILEKHGTGFGRQNVHSNSFQFSHYRTCKECGKKESPCYYGPSSSDAPMLLGSDQLVELAVQLRGLPVVLVGTTDGTAELPAQGLAHCKFLSVSISHYETCRICEQKNKT